MISERIRTIASLIDAEESVVDVGCDHGYLAITLRGNGHKARIVCSDNKKGPLGHCQVNVEKYGLENVELCLSDGLQSVTTQCDVVVIAGMGYNTALRILSEGSEYLKGVNKIIIQVNRHVDPVRRWAEENGWLIENELMIREYKYYEIEVLTRGDMVLDELQRDYGPILLKEKSEIFLSRYITQLKKLERLRDRLPEGHPDIEGIARQIEELRQILE